MIILHIVKINSCMANGVASSLKECVEHESISNKVGIFNIHGYEDRNNHFIYNYSNYRCISNLPVPFNNPDIIVFNEVYKIEYIKLYKECINRKIKYIIVPHGCLISKAQSKKILKKKIGNLLLFNKFISSANAIQFLNENEKQNSHFVYKKSIISPNGFNLIDIPVISNKKNNLIYIGRYDIYTKGLDLLLKSIVIYASWMRKNNIILELYGIGNKKDINYLKKIVNINNIKDIVTINGPIYGTQKVKAIINSRAFIQLSRHEGMPMGIIEALGYGVPCIVTKGTNLDLFVQKNKCGIFVEYSSESIINAIINIYKKNNYNKMCSNAQKAISDYYCWNNIIPCLVIEYEKILKND